MNADAPVIVENLNHYYGKGALRRQILFDVSTTIPAGEIVIVTGPSGSGKTTLLTLVGALRAPQEGKLQVLGRRLDGARGAALEDVRRNIGFIFQQHNLLGALTASQNVQLGLRVTGRAARTELKKKAEAMLEAVGLGAHVHKRAEQMSGGQRRQAACASSARNCAARARPRSRRYAVASASSSSSTTCSRRSLQPRTSSWGCVPRAATRAASCGAGPGRCWQP
jgi:putative ABC transport system ATP-binding protein